MSTRVCSQWKIRSAPAPGASTGSVAEEGDGKDDEADIMRYFAARSWCQDQSERRHRNAGERHQREQNEPVQRQVRLDAARVDERRDGQDDRREMTPWMAPERIFSNAPARSDRVLHAVLDLSGEAELGDICRATDCTPWNMIEMPKHRDEHVAKALSPAAPPPPTDWRSGKMKRKTKQSRTVGPRCAARRCRGPFSVRDVAQQEGASAARLAETRCVAVRR